MVPAAIFPFVVRVLGPFQLQVLIRLPSKLFNLIGKLGNQMDVSDTGDDDLLFIL